MKERQHETEMMEKIVKIVKTVEIKSENFEESQKCIHYNNPSKPRKRLKQ